MTLAILSADIHSEIAALRSDLAKVEAAIPAIGKAASAKAKEIAAAIDDAQERYAQTLTDVGITGYEDRDTLDQDDALKARIEKIRLAVGERMNLGDVREKSVPKKMLVAPPRNGGAVTVRSFIPHRAHASIGVLGAVSVATACLDLRHGTGRQWRRHQRGHAAHRMDREIFA